MTHLLLLLHKHAYEDNVDALSAAVKSASKDELNAKDAHGEARTFDCAEREYEDDR
jgi:hypothetical protein